MIRAISLVIMHSFLSISEVLVWRFNTLHIATYAPPFAVGALSTLLPFQPFLLERQYHHA